MEKSAPAPPAGKKQNKKQRQAAMKKGGKSAFDDAPDPETADPEPEPSRPAPPPAPANGKGKFTSQAVFAAAADATNGNDDDGEDAMLSAPSKVYGGPPPTIVGRKRLGSLSAPSGWDTEGTSASTPRPAPKIPANLQALAASMSTPPPFGLKPLMGGAAHTQPSGERPGATGLGMNSSTIRARGAGAAGQSGSGGTARSLWGLFGGGSGDAAPKQEADPWAVPGSFGGGDEAEADGDDGEGDDAGGDDDWTPISKGSAPVEKPQAQAPPVSLAQRLRRGSEAAAPSSPAPRVAGKTAVPPPAASKVVVAAAASKKVNGKKGAKGKKVMIEDVPDEETDNRGEVLPVDSRHIFDDAEPSVILEPKPSVPPGTYDSIISYTDEENERKAAKSNAAANSWPDDAWTDAAATKETKESTVKHEKTAATGGGGGGVWGAGSNVAKSVWGASTAEVEEAAEEPTSFASAFGNGGRNGKGGSQPVAPAASVWGQISGKDKGKGKGAGGGDEPAPKPMSKAQKRKGK